MFKADGHNSILRSIMSTLQKQTKIEHISVIFDIELQTGPKKQKTEEAAAISNNFKIEATLFSWCLLRQKKDILTKNVSFFRW